MGGSETKIIASLDTVAGEACSKLSVSNKNETGVGILKSNRMFDAF